MCLVLTIKVNDSSFPIFVLRHTVTLPSFSMTVYSGTSNSMIKAVEIFFLQSDHIALMQFLLSSSIIDMTAVLGVPMSTSLGTDVILATNFSTPSLSWSLSIVTLKHTLS